MTSLKSNTTKEPKRLPVLLRRAWYGLNQTFRQRIAHLGITPDQFSILRWVHESGTAGLTQRALTDLMASDSSTIAGTLSRMEKADLVKRQPHESDRRARRIQLQPDGIKALNAGHTIAQDLQDHILESLPIIQRELFLANLEVIAEACSVSHTHSLHQKSSAIPPGSRP